MKKITLILLAFISLHTIVRADEGMWLINAFEKNIYPMMKKQGLKLLPGEIYNENSPSLANAIVAINGGMGTGSVISDQGLIITNHHVASGDIHSLSTAEKNYLENGFWALNRSDELPVKGKTVYFVRKIINVTPEFKELYEEMKAKNQLGPFASRTISGAIEKRYKAKEDYPYEFSCNSFWGGELYLLFCIEEYRDVRLVGAPPVSIGAFGGEQDNWGWPQHKGDFALYRVYGDKDGRPADYSKDNVPIKPVKVLNISTSGVNNGDYAMVIGFPGTTNRYMSSFCVEEKRTIKNPVTTKARRDILDVMKKHMEVDPAIRLIYSDAYFNLSNYADYCRWETISLRRYNVASIRAAEEELLQQWIGQSPERISKYGTLLDNLKKGYAARAQAVRENTYYIENWWRPSDMRLYANRFALLAAKLKKNNNNQRVSIDDNEIKEYLTTKGPLSKLDVETEKEIMIKLAEDFLANTPREMWGDPLNKMYDSFGGNLRAMFDDVYARTFCSSVEKLRQFFTTPRTPEEIMNDPMVALAASVPSSIFKDNVDAVSERLGYNPSSMESQYARAIYAMRNDKKIAQYPNANSTMRITYGNVCPITPCDGVSYDWRSTIDGYTEKFNPEDYEFRVDQKMKSLIASREWGRWGDKGKMYVNFITNNDITGGNSGSPVLNGRGDVIGLAFDGNRESMAGDVYYHPQFTRSVCVDIRFVLWVMDKYAGAGKLIEEMKLVK